MLTVVTAGPAQVAASHAMIAQLTSDQQANVLTLLDYYMNKLSVH
jgi:hypothetical protein